MIVLSICKGEILNEMLPYSLYRTRAWSKVMYYRVPFTHVAVIYHITSNRLNLLGEVGQVLNDLGDEGEGTGSAVVRVLLHEAEERGGHDGGTEEAEEQGGADEALADVLVPSGQTLLLPCCKHLLQLPREHTGEAEERVRLLLN